MDHPGVAGPKTGTAPALVKQGRARDSELMILTPVSRYYYIDYNRPGRRSKFYLPTCAVLCFCRTVALW